MSLLPSSEAEIFCPLEGRCATLERVGDAGRSRGVSTGTLERGGDRPAGSGGCEWAARWASLSPFLSSEWEAGRGPSWAQLPYQVFPFLKNSLSTPIRVSLILVPDSSPRGFGRVNGFGQRVIRRFPL